MDVCAYPAGSAVPALRKEETYRFRGCGRCCTSSQGGDDLPVPRLRAVLYQLSGRRLTGSQAAGGAATALRKEETYRFRGCGQCCNSSQGGDDLLVPRLRAVLHQLSGRRLTGSQAAGGAATALREEMTYRFPGCRRCCTSSQCGEQTYQFPGCRCCCTSSQGGGQTYRFPGCGRCCTRSQGGGQTYRFPGCGRCCTSSQ